MNGPLLVFGPRSVGYDFGPDQHRGMGSDSVIIGVYRGDGFYLDSMNDMPTL